MADIISITKLFMPDIFASFVCIFRFLIDISVNLFSSNNAVPNILCDDEVEKFEELGRGKEKEDENSIKLLITKHQRSQSELKYLVGFIAILLLFILWK